MQRFHATCEAGLEPVLAGELGALGAQAVKEGRRGVGFSGDRQLLWRANLACRTANRILMAVASFDVRDRDDLYNGAVRVPWERWVSHERTIAIDARTGHRALHQPQFISQVVKDAVCDRLRREQGRRPDVDRDQPDVPMMVHIDRRRATLSLDSSGARLHRRGYRGVAGQAPLRETLAAGLLGLAGWDGSDPLLDPMCGSGTIAIEAGLVATRTAPGLLRLGGEGFAFERWLDHRIADFLPVVKSVESQQRDAPAPVHASDADPRMVSVARKNAERAGVRVSFDVVGVRDVEPPTDRGVLITNPPYGARLGEVEELCGLYSDFGDALKHRFAGWTAWLLVGDKRLLGSVGLRTSRRIALKNGPIDCRLARFDLYEGSRKG